MLCACNHDWIPSGLQIYIYIYISTLGSLGVHLMPIGFHVGSPLATRWARGFPIGAHCYAVGSPCHSHMGSHWSSTGPPWYSHSGHPLYVHEIPMWPQWDPLGFPCDPHRRFSCGAHVLSICFLVGVPFSGFLPGQCF